MHRAKYHTLRRKGYKAATAYRMATDHERALDNGITFEWEDDWDPDLSWCECEGDPDHCMHCGIANPLRDYWGPRPVCRNCKRRDPVHDHIVEVCIARDGNGEILDVLGGIVDAGNASDWRSYAFDVECEMAGEALHNLARNPAILVG